MQTDNKVLISNITSDKVVGKDIIDGGLHHFVCDKTYPNGNVFPNMEKGKLYYVDAEAYSIEEMANVS